VPAARKFLIDLLVAATAIGGSKMCGNHKTVVVLVVSILTFLRLVTVKAANAFLGVLAHFVFMDNGILLGARGIRRTFRWP
jgi:hypothetical protein